MSLGVLIYYYLFEERYSEILHKNLSHPLNSDKGENDEDLGTGSFQSAFSWTMDLGIHREVVLDMEVSSL